MKNLNSKIPTLTVQFDQPLKAQQIQSFRGAVTERAIQLEAHFEAAGITTDIWHQHKIKDGANVHYRYPLIQYQLKQGKASITAIGKGVTALKIWLQHNTQPIQWGNKKVQFSLLGYPAEQKTEVSISTKYDRKYRLYKWVALNQAKYQQYQQAVDMETRLQLLQKALQNHLVALSFTILPGNQKAISSQLLELTSRRYIQSYGSKLLAFDCVFSTNIKLPHFIGIGKGVSLGFGKQQPLGLYQSDTQKISALMDSINSNNS